MKMGRRKAEGTEHCEEWGITRKQARSLGGIEYLESLPDLSRRVLINSLGWKVGLPKCPRKVRKAYVAQITRVRVYAPKPPAHATPRSIAKVERMMYLAERLAA
jgi:hypothetical protein